MEIEKLADLYLRNELSYDQREELMNILKTDEEKSRQFTEYLYETGQLIDAADQLSEVRPHLKVLDEEVDTKERKLGWTRYIESVAALSAVIKL